VRDIAEALDALGLNRVSDKKVAVQ